MRWELRKQEWILVGDSVYVSVHQPKGVWHMNECRRLRTGEAGCVVHCNLLHNLCNSKLIIKIGLLNFKMKSTGRYNPEREPRMCMVLIYGKGKTINLCGKNRI